MRTLSLIWGFGTIRIKMYPIFSRSRSVPLLSSVTIPLNQPRLFLIHKSPSTLAEAGSQRHLRINWIDPCQRRRICNIWTARCEGLRQSEPVVAAGRNRARSRVWVFPWKKHPALSGEPLSVYHQHFRWNKTGPRERPEAKTGISGETRVHVHAYRGYCKVGESRKSGGKGQLFIPHPLSASCRANHF